MIAVYIDTADELPRTVPCALRVAAARGNRVALFVARPGQGDGSTREIDLAEPGEGAGSNVAIKIRALLTKIFGETGWQPASLDAESEKTDGEAGENDSVVRISFVCITSGQPAVVLCERIALLRPDLLVGVQLEVEDVESESSARRRRILRQVTGEMVLVRPGEEREFDEGVLVAVADGVHSSAALCLARDLGRSLSAPVTAIYVETVQLSVFGQAVGEKKLDRLIHAAVGADDGGMARQVVVNQSAPLGILAAYEQHPHHCIVLGTSTIAGMGEPLRGSVGKKLVRATKQANLVLVRAPQPLSLKARRHLEEVVVRWVPQLDREHRVSLVERIQSNSSWSFDFAALMALATAIAAMGMLANSAAVVIGAMLVAPLMTPLIGAGLSLVQGNRVLGNLSLKSVVLGFLTAFSISAVIGALAADLRGPTPEMIARHWPVLLDLAVAFVAGLAGAYTLSRPGLLSALPGVAIAAALVPPIATSGLSLAMGEWQLAAGAALLFLTNMVAIVLASATSLWAVGLRYTKENPRWVHATGIALATVVLVLGTLLTMFPRPFVEHSALRQAIDAALASHSDWSDLRVDRIHVEPLQDGDVPWVIVVRLTGPNNASAEVAKAVHDIAEDYFAAPFELRLETLLLFTAPG